MKKTYIKPQATVVAIEDKSQTLCAGSPNTTYDTTWETTFTTSDTGGNESRSKSHGIWDDEE